MKIIKVHKIDNTIKKNDAEPEPTYIDIRKEMMSITRQFSKAMKGLEKWRQFCKSEEAEEMYGPAEAADQLYDINLKMDQLKKTIVPLQEKLRAAINQFDDWQA